MNLEDISRRFDIDGSAVLRGLLPAAVLARVRTELEGWVERQAQILRDDGVARDARGKSDRGLPNASETIRWSCDWRYQDAAQSTMRAEGVHLARSAAHPGDVVASATQWAASEFHMSPRGIGGSCTTHPGIGNPPWGRPL